MHDHTRPGAEMFVCDFCETSWSEDRPMMEGHQGSLICAPCLEVAYRLVVLSEQTSLPPKSATCTMCLEERDQPMWQSPSRDEAVVCLRCIKQSATAFEKDPESEWVRPSA